MRNTLKPGTPEWEAEANRVARTWGPSIVPCPGCAYPVVRGYLCPDKDCPGEPSKAPQAL